MDATPRLRRYLKRKSTLKLSDYFQGSDQRLQALLSVLILPKHQRSEEELEELMRFTQKIKVFAEMSEEMREAAHRECCDCLEVEKEGDPADKFYIILSGSCSVLSTSPLLPNHQRLLGILRQGDYFGELALLNNQPRMASILCREHCYFACLSRDDYLRILSKMQDRLISVKVELLLKQPVFRRMSKNALIKFTYYFKIKHYKRKQVVFESGTDANWLYLVKSGDFQLTKDVNLGQFRVQVDVTLLSTGEFLASEDILNRRNYTYSCVCHSTTGELMALGKKDFFSMMGSEENMHYFAELGKLKEEYRKERLKTAIKVETEKRVGGGKRISGHVRWNSCKEEDLMGGRKEELQNSGFLSRTYSSYLHSTLEHSGIKSKPSLPRSPHSVSRKPLSLTLHMHKLRRISTLYPSH